jgi:hypothetical protein
MKNLLTLFVCLLTVHVFAQAPCEVYKKFTTNTASSGSKIIELRNGGYVILGSTNLGTSGVTNPGNPMPLIIKTDNCGNVGLIKSFENLQGSNSVYPIDLLELNDESIVYASNYSYGQDIQKGLRLLKVKLDGSLIWLHIFGDTSKKYYPEKLTQLTANKFLLTGYVHTNKKRASAIIVDTDGVVLFDSSFNSDTSSASYFTSTYINQPNEIELFGVEDSSILHVKIDTLGNILYQQKITNTQAGFKKIDRVIVNETGNNLLISGNNNQFLYIARLTKNMQLITDITTESQFYYVSNIKNLGNNQYAYAWRKVINPYMNYTKVMTIDSLLQVTWYDSIYHQGQYPIYRYFYDFIQSKNNSLVYMGCEYFTTGSSNTREVLFKKKNTTIFITKIQISGPNYIDVKNGSIQLEATITPTNAANQQLIWSVSDTNLASITQTGMVTAKNNGVVIVTATSTDGSLIKGTTSISINNQKVGINELVVDESQITLYPNPAKNQLTVLCNVAKVQAIHLLELSGKMLHTFTNNTTINLSQCASGMYLVKIETDKGVVFKKLIISK